MTHRSSVMWWARILLAHTEVPLASSGSHFTNCSTDIVWSPTSRLDKISKNGPFDDRSSYHFILFLSALANSLDNLINKSNQTNKEGLRIKICITSAVAHAVEHKIIE